MGEKKKSMCFLLRGSNKSVDSHISHSRRNVLLHPLQIFVLGRSHNKWKRHYFRRGQRRAPEILPTSLCRSFWELLESGLDPLIFIPSETQTQTQKWKNYLGHSEALQVLGNALYRPLMVRQTLLTRVCRSKGFDYTGLFIKSEPTSFHFHCVASEWLPQGGAQTNVE